MIIAVAIKENHPKSKINEHFGRTDWFAIINTKDNKVDYIENPFRYLNEQAGCKVAEMLMKDHNIELAVAGRFGTKVAEFFKNNKTQMVIVEGSKTLTDIITQTKNKI